MRVSARHFLALAIFLAIGHASFAEYNVDDYCKIVKDGTKLASLESCTTYYVCSKGTATKKTCDTNQAYSKNDQTCKVASQVDCSNSVDNPCAGSTDGVFVSKPGTCDGWIYCVNGKESHSGSCGTLTFKNGECTYDKCVITSDDDSTTVLKSPCDVVPNNFFFGDFQDCTVWYYCSDDTSVSNPRTGECTDGTVFSVSKEKCVYAACEPSGVDGSVPGVDSTVTEKCTTAEKDLKKSDKKKCSVYYICDGTNYVKNSCSSGEFFDVRVGECKSRQAATPNENCDRCEGSTKQFVNSVDEDCAGYIYCKDSVKSSVNACGTGSYFSEAAQACKVGTSTLSSYAESNGACIDAVCSVLLKADCEQSTNKCEWDTTNTKCKTSIACASVALKEYCSSDDCTWDDSTKGCTESGSDSGSENVIECSTLSKTDCETESTTCKWVPGTCKDGDDECTDGDGNDITESGACNDASCSWTPDACEEVES